MTAWIVALIAIGVISCFISYHYGRRKGEKNAIRDIRRMEGRPLEQKLDDYRQAQKRPSFQNRNRTKKSSSQNRNRSKKT